MIPAIVKRGGEIEALGRRYWAPELASKAGWEVELHFDQDDDVFPSVWTKGRMHRLGTAGLIGNTGFADMEKARVAAGVAREQRESVIRWQIAEVLNVLDQRFQRARQGAEPGNAASRHGGVGNIVRLLRNAWQLLFKNGEVGRDEPAQGVDLDLQKIEAILVRGEALFNGAGHNGQSPIVETGAERNPPVDAAHRLSEGAK